MCLVIRSDSELAKAFKPKFSKQVTDAQTSLFGSSPIINNPNLKKEKRVNKKGDLVTKYVRRDVQQGSLFSDDAKAHHDRVKATQTPLEFVNTLKEAAKHHAKGDGAHRAFWEGVGKPEPEPQESAPEQKSESDPPQPTEPEQEPRDKDAVSLQRALKKMDDDKAMRQLVAYTKGDEERLGEIIYLTSTYMEEDGEGNASDITDRLEAAYERQKSPAGDHYKGDALSSYEGAGGRTRDKVDPDTQHIYASPSRPLDTIWASKIRPLVVDKKAEVVDSPNGRTKTSAHSYIYSDEPLEPGIIEGYELKPVATPSKQVLKNEAEDTHATITQEDGKHKVELHDSGEKVEGSSKEFDSKEEAEAHAHKMLHGDSPKVGDTKTENGVTYQFNSNHRWEKVSDDEFEPEGRVLTAEEQAGRRGIQNLTRVEYEGFKASAKKELGFPIRIRNLTGSYGSAIEFRPKNDTSLDSKFTDDQLEAILKFANEYGLTTNHMAKELFVEKKYFIWRGGVHFYKYANEGFKPAKLPESRDDFWAGKADPKQAEELADFYYAPGRKPIEAVDKALEMAGGDKEKAKILIAGLEGYARHVKRRTFKYGAKLKRLIDEKEPPPAEKRADGKYLASDGTPFVIRENTDKGGIEIEYDSRPDDRVTKELKDAGFRWSKYSGHWWAKGSNADAVALVNRLKGNASAPAQSNAPVAPKAEPTLPQHDYIAHADKLNKLADGMQKQIDKLNEPMYEGRNITHRRAGQIASKMADAQSAETFQRVIRNMAIASADNTLPEELQSLKTKTDIDYMLRKAKYMDDLKRKGQLTTNYLMYPKFRVHEWTWRGFIEDVEKHKMSGMKAHMRHMHYREGTDSPNSETRKAAEAIRSHVKRKGLSTKYSAKENKQITNGTDTLLNQLAEIERVERLGYDTPDKFIQALESILRYKTRDLEREKEDKIRKLELAQSGRSNLDFFATPKPLAEHIVDLADIQPGMKVLEPSAGTGNIADVIKQNHADADLDVIEMDGDRRKLLEAKGHKLVGYDTLEHTGQYDRAVLNPPFSTDGPGTDITHVRHVFDQLKPGGRLVAIMSEGPFFRSDTKSVQFREWLDQLGGYSEQNDEGSFKTSGTGVNTRTVVIDKPATVAKAINKRILIKRVIRMCHPGL